MNISDEQIYAILRAQLGDISDHGLIRSVARMEEFFTGVHAELVAHERSVVVRSTRGLHPLHAGRLRSPTEDVQDELIVLRQRVLLLSLQHADQLQRTSHGVRGRDEAEDGVLLQRVLHRALPPAGESDGADEASAEDQTSDAGEGGGSDSGAEADGGGGAGSGSLDDEDGVRERRQADGQQGQRQGQLHDGDVEDDVEGVERREEVVTGPAAVCVCVPVRGGSVFMSRCRRPGLGNRRRDPLSFSLPTDTIATAAPGKSRTTAQGQTRTESRCCLADLCMFPPESNPIPQSFPFKPVLGRNRSRFKGLPRDRNRNQYRWAKSANE